MTCCVTKNSFEVCSDCRDFPCSRFDAERQGYDSFVTHRKVFENLNCIKSKGINYFINQQKIRMDILIDLLNNFDDGRSKSFFCISCTLLPTEKLQQVYKGVVNLKGTLGVKEQNKLFKEHFHSAAKSLGIELKLNRR